MASLAPQPTNLPLGHSVCCVEVYVQVHICKCIFTKKLNLKNKQNEIIIIIKNLVVAATSKEKVLYMQKFRSFKESRGPFRVHRRSRNLYLRSLLLRVTDMVKGALLLRPRRSPPPALIYDSPEAHLHADHLFRQSKVQVCDLKFPLLSTTGAQVFAILRGF